MRIRKKLRSRRGETLAETLVALLIIGLASAALAAMIGAAVHMSTASIKRDNELRAAVTALETGTGTETTAGTVKVSVGGAEQDVTVIYESAGDGMLYAYHKGGGG